MRTPKTHPTSLARRHSWRLFLLFGALSAVGTGVWLTADPVAAVGWALRASIRARGGTFVHVPGVVLQSGRSDCGPAALSTLIKTLGGSPPPLSQLASMAGTSASGTTFAGLSFAAQRLGFPNTLQRLDDAAIEALKVPLIAWVHRGHFVTVVPDSSESVLVVDPQIGPYRIDVHRLRRFWSGEALVPTPAPPGGWWVSHQPKE